MHIPVHSPWLAACVDATQTIPIILITMAGPFPDRPHILSFSIFPPPDVSVPIYYHQKLSRLNTVHIKTIFLNFGLQFCFPKYEAPSFKWDGFMALNHIELHSKKLVHLSLNSPKRKSRISTNLSLRLAQSPFQQGGRRLGLRALSGSSVQ